MVVVVVEVVVVVVEYTTGFWPYTQSNTVTYCSAPMSTNGVIVAFNPTLPGCGVTLVIVPTGIPGGNDARLRPDLHDVADAHHGRRLELDEQFVRADLTRRDVADAGASPVTAERCTPTAEHRIGQHVNLRPTVPRLDHLADETFRRRSTACLSRSPTPCR